MTKADFIEIYQDVDEQRLLDANEKRTDYERAAREGMEIVIAEKYSSKLSTGEEMDNPLEVDELINPGIYNQVGLTKENYVVDQLKLFGKYNFKR